jgi:hypothetical protein
MTNRFRLGTAGHVLRFIGGVCLLGFKVLFGPSEKSQARKDGRRLVAEIDTSFSSLLAASGGRIQAHGIQGNKGRHLLAAFDSAAVILAFPEIRFRILRGRGQIQVQVAPVHAGEEWHDLVLLWRVLATQESPTAPTASDSLDTIAKFLEEHWRVLVAAMADGGGYRETEEKLRGLGELSLEEQMGLDEKDVS